MPANLQMLQNLPKEFELPALGPMSVAVLRSEVLPRSRAVDAMYEQFVNTLALMPKMAMKIGRKYKFSELMARHWALCVFGL